MIGSLVPDIEGIDWTYDDVAREMEDLEMTGDDLDDEASPFETDEVTDDEILRASEEMRQDEG